MIVARRIAIRGIVQGVGFRPWIYRLAREEGLSGSVGNDATGVVIDAFAASDAAIDGFIARLQRELPAAARIDALTQRTLGADRAPASFEIAPSSPEGELRPSIPADLATCDACVREIFDARDRRYRYAFTSCTACGPRYTITREFPYDRATTTMAPFEMCAACRREYEDPADRRFHAQPNACPICGPKLRLVDSAGRDLEIDPARAIAKAADLLAGGAIVALKGLGGFHLACDAGRDDVVRELRRRKHRGEKAFAVMVRDLAAAERVAFVGDAERELLAGSPRPIVLLRRREGGGISGEVAPRSERLGMMLPYTPLHHVLLADVERPLVMTSGNSSDEPIATDDADALARLGDIADAFLLHDRAIASRADDSVAFVALAKPVVTRRSRGYVPRGIALGKDVQRPLLACGAHLKNTFCIAAGDSAYFGPHIGDLDNVAAYDGYEREIERMERYLRIVPEVVAHDLHPDYLSTRYAQNRAGVTRIAVQHHHAHVASAMVEHGIEGPVIGVAFDGTGLGTDGTSWGGEILVAERHRFERVASLRAVPLAGGDRAVRDVWRIALAMLDDAFDGAPPLEKLALFASVPPRDVAVVRRMIATSTNAPLASGAGRYFDAFGAIGLGRAHASFEGQIAIEWEQAAGGTFARPYPFAIETACGVQRIDLREALRAAVGDLLRGRSISEISAGFHDTLVLAVAEVLRGLPSALPVALTGGCFQNVRLVESLAGALGSDRKLLVHGDVPPGDGGIALGQLAVADAIVRRGETCA